jgi:putative Mg2+ transporter-C (MgtC) family protein
VGSMPLVVGWNDLALRLLLTVVASALIGLNRDEHGRPAGLRTTLLVCLAASVAMIQANMLLPTSGKSHDSFITLDLMRLPLGILSGMGFLGAGAIVRRSDLVLGVTTAATLWIVTVIGLCFGGGQITLGVCATVLTLGVLWGLKVLESYIRQEHRGTLLVRLSDGGVDAAEIAGLLISEGYNVSGTAATYSEGCDNEIQYALRWRGPHIEAELPSFVPRVIALSGVKRLQWTPQGFGTAR